MKHWWVSQGKTFKTEISGGFLWSPKTRKDGGYNRFYDNMQLITPGDMIFSFHEAKIKALGVVTKKAVSAARPDLETAHEIWSDEGWLVEAEFEEFTNPIRPKDHIERLRPHLPAKYSPLKANGNGNQGVYLASISNAMANALIEPIEAEYKTIFHKLLTKLTIINNTEYIEASLEDLFERTDIEVTQKRQLMNARLGQGPFKHNVLVHETYCRITKIENPEHLRASHIKPWRDSTDKERVDGSNGLLLAPHIDHFFDRGYLSFSDHGLLQLSSTLSKEIVQAWGIPAAGTNVGVFTKKQQHYLKYHRENIFKP